MEANNTIKSISYNQHKILYNIMVMHNNGKPFECDMTYSCGNFYGTFNIDCCGKKCKDNITIPEPLYKFDVCPMDETIGKIEPNGSLPLENNSISSIVVDLPFVISPPNAPSMNRKAVNEDGSKNNIIARRFASYYPVYNLINNYYHWMKECYRVLDNNGIVVWKCQNCITGSKYLPTEELSWLFAEQCGFETLDKFTLLAKQRLISGKIKTQQHARNFSSVFWVFRKSKKKAIKYFKTSEENIISDFSEKLILQWV